MHERSAVTCPKEQGTKLNTIGAHEYRGNGVARLIRFVSAALRRAGDHAAVATKRRDRSIYRQTL